MPVRGNFRGYEAAAREQDARDRDTMRALGFSAADISDEMRRRERGRSR